MKDYFDIHGTPIKYSSIKDYRIVQKEFIYRPVYFEEVVIEQKILKRVTSSRYVFEQMLPYAAILDESDRRGVFGNTNAFGQSIGKEILSDIRQTVGEKFRIKAIKDKKYKCIKQSGRIFSTYLDEIPVLVRTNNGQLMDITKEDELYSLIEQSSKPAVNLVYALQIQADETFIFYGNGIQLRDVEAEYKRLQFELEQYQEEKKNQKGLFGKRKLEKKEDTTVKLPTLPKLSLPSFGLLGKNAVSKEKEIIEIKKLCENGEISEEEAQKRIQEIIDLM